MVYALCALLISFETACAQYVRYLSLEEREATRPPRGHVDFCAREPYECAPVGGPTSIRVDTTTYMLIESAHEIVRRIVVPTSDLKSRGTQEYWGAKIKDSAIEGDCEDFALLVRGVLAERGIPKTAMRIIVVRDEDGEGHAVLAIVAQSGRILISDIKKDKIVDWYTLPYKWEKWTSGRNPRKWVKISDPRKRQ